MVEGGEGFGGGRWVQGWAKAFEGGHGPVNDQTSFQLTGNVRNIVQRPGDRVFGGEKDDSE